MLPIALCGHAKRSNVLLFVVEIVYVAGNVWVQFFKFGYLFYRHWELESLRVQSGQVLLVLLHSLWVAFYRVYLSQNGVQKTQLVLIFYVDSAAFVG